MRRALSHAVVFLTVGYFIGRFSGQPAATAEGDCGDQELVCGDVNCDKKVNITDPIYLLTYLFRGGSPPCGIAPPTPVGCPLPATGQTNCYGATGNEIACDNANFSGQDGFYQAGCPTLGRFVDNLDGTVTDTCTGLMWQQNTADMNGDGQISPEWDLRKDVALWQDALMYCEGLSFAGHDDWRLPNVRELQSIVDYERFDPAIDPVFEAVSEWYWSSTSCAVTPNDAWVVYFFDGYVYGSIDFKVLICRVRAVRNAD